MKRKRKILRLGFLGLLLTVGMIILCNWLVNIRTEKQLVSQIDKMPHFHVGMVLGTSQYLRDGRTNLYFKYRIDAAVALFQAGKIHYLLVSGDNRAKNYNEPERMRRELVKRGIPNERIILDYAGFRTLDSVIRSHKVFGQDSLAIISQKFHNQRAVYIARHHGIIAIGFNAKDVENYSGLKTKVREWLARVKMFIDLYIIHKAPYFLGDPVPIPDNE